MRTYEPTHFYLIFDPFLKKEYFTKENDKNTQGHEFQRQLKSKYENKKNDNKPYMYWGKLSLTKKQTKLGQELKDILIKNQKNNFSTHLYISDFHHLWVAKVEDICFGDENEFYQNSLDFFREYQGQNVVEAWFKISDMDLIGTTKEETDSKIKCLTTFSNGADIEVSPYISNLRYPVHVKDLACVYPSHFDNSEPLVLTKVIENESYYEKIKVVINKYCIEKSLWENLKPSVQKEIIRAEMNFFEQKSQHWNSLYFSYYKALEWQLNYIILNHLRTKYDKNKIYVLKSEKGPPIFYTHDNPNWNDRQNRVCLHEFEGSFSINTLCSTFFKSSKQIVSNTNNLETIKDLGGIHNFLTTLMNFLNSNNVIDTRNIITHEDVKEVTEEEFLKIRTELLGVSKEGIFMTLAKIAISSHEFSQKMKNSHRRVPKSA